MVEPQPVAFVVDDEPGVRAYVRAVLEAEGLNVVALASAEELLRQEPPEGPGCLVLDVFLPGLNGLEAQQQIKDKYHHLPIVFISGQGSISMSVQAMKAGAVDFLTKPFSGEELRSAVEWAIGMSRSICAEQAQQREQDELVGSLTPRELEVLRLAASGLLNKQIAAELDIVEKTVKVHRSRGMRKLGLRTVAELVRLAGTLGWPHP